VYASYIIEGQCETNKGNTKELEFAYDGGSENLNFETIGCKSYLPHHE
jgi:hypothetical protein